MVSLICSVVEKKTSINEKLSFQLMIMKEGKIIYHYNMQNYINLLSIGQFDI